MNPIAQEALRALTATGYPTRNHRCQQFARLVVEQALGGHPMGEPNPLTATLAARRLLAQGQAFPVSALEEHGGLREGDLLYKTQGCGGDGHVGIFVGGNRVAENSSVHWQANNGRDARGVRSLGEFGAFQVVARFAVPEAPAWTLDCEGRLLLVPVERNARGQAVVPLRALCEALGFGLRFDRATGRLSMLRPRSLSQSPTTQS